VIETDPVRSTQDGGTWWDVPVAEVSNSADVVDASSGYREQQEKR
jgi:3D-(3,5/4)-trihydroxycyclohexane-1,2-dione acylhydrolase (decyclizing)